MSDHQKKKYQDLADADKLRYKEQMDQLMNNGFFINSEGVKSTDIAIKKRRASGDNKRKANTQPEVMEKTLLNKKSPKRVRKE